MYGRTGQLQVDSFDSIFQIRTIECQDNEFGRKDLSISAYGYKAGINNTLIFKIFQNFFCRVQEVRFGYYTSANINPLCFSDPGGGTANLTCLPNSCF